MLLSGCCLVHDWKDATCDTAKLCIRCGDTYGEALGHLFTDYISNNDATTDNCKFFTFTL